MEQLGRGLLTPHFDLCRDYLPCIVSKLDLMCDDFDPTRWAFVHKTDVYFDAPFAEFDIGDHDTDIAANLCVLHANIHC
jgi:hypothetical protein